MSHYFDYDNIPVLNKEYDVTNGIAAYQVKIGEDQTPDHPVGNVVWMCQEVLRVVPSVHSKLNLNANIQEQTRLVKTRLKDREKLIGVQWGSE